VRWLNISNYGIVKVKRRDITLMELEKELFGIFCKEWPWHIKGLAPNKYLVRFLPHKKVADIRN
jgi:hypothetical protein